MGELLQTSAFWVAIAAALGFAVALTALRQFLRKKIFREDMKKEKNEK